MSQAGTAELSSRERMNAKQLSGSWKAFDLTAVPIDEQDPVTGEMLWAVTCLLAPAHCATQTP